MKAFASLFISAAIISAAGPQPFLNWFAEAALILIAGSVLIATHSRYPLTKLTYALFLTFSLVVFVGAHYTYARVPFGDWMSRAFGFRRNHFDRIGHIFQGVAPAILFRELLIRRVSFPRGRALFWVVCGLCLGLAAMFELLEWQYALIQHGPVPDDLGAQGDPWDAQADMLMALVGAATSQLMFARMQDRQLNAKPARGHEGPHLRDERTVQFGDRVNAEQLQRTDHVTS
jgi:putative membrane protein